MGVSLWRAMISVLDVLNLRFCTLRRVAGNNRIPAMG